MKTYNLPIVALMAGSLPASAFGSVRTDTKAGQQRVIATPVDFDVTEKSGRTHEASVTVETQEKPNETTVKTVFPVDLGWTKRQQKQFHDLAVKEALGTITPGELQELERLDLHREHTIAPVSGAEVIRRIRQQKATAALLKALETYVRIYTPPKSAGKTRREAEGKAHPV